MEKMRIKITPSVARDTVYTNLIAKHPHTNRTPSKRERAEKSFKKYKRADW